MVNISFTCRVLDVNTDAKTMTVLYESEGRQPMPVSMPLPPAGMKLEDVAPLYAPTGIWEMMEREVEVPRLGEEFIYTPPEPAAAPPAAPVNPVPELVKKWQARTVLATMGVLEAVDAYMAAKPVDDPVRQAWEFGDNVVRSSPGVAAIGTMLGKTDAEIDDFFRLADSLVA